MLFMRVTPHGSVELAHFLLLPDFFVASILSDFRVLQPEELPPIRVANPMCGSQLTEIR